MFQYAAPPSKEEIAKLKKEYEEKELAIKLENERLHKELLEKRLEKEKEEQAQAEAQAQGAELEIDLGLGEDEEVSVDLGGFNLFADVSSDSEIEEVEVHGLFDLGDEEVSV